MKELVLPYSKKKGTITVGGFASGGNEPLMVTIDFNDDDPKTDKTFGEIYEAYLAGRNVILNIVPLSETPDSPSRNGDAKSAGDPTILELYNTVYMVEIDGDDNDGYMGAIFGYSNTLICTASTIEELMDEYLTSGIS